MASEQRISANRQNARKSTGPKSASGKTRSSHNALRHGLEAVHIHDPETQKKIERLATLICDDDSGPIEHQLATTIAECQVMISRIRAARIAAIERMRTLDEPALQAYQREIQSAEAYAAANEGKLLKAAQILKAMVTSVVKMQKEAIAAIEAKRRSSADDGSAPQADTYDPGSTIPRSDAGSCILALPELLSIERYERRTLSRRRRAIEMLSGIRGAKTFLDRVVSTRKTTQS